MKAQLFFAAALLGCLGFAPAGPSNAVSPSTKIVGDYVEARTASVFAGACHFNGELVTTGHDAIMAWSITVGTWKGTNLDGVRAMAAVTCDANLLDEKAPRKSELMVDSSASGAQVAAMKDLLESKIGAAIGSVTAVRRGVVSFTRVDRSYTVSAANFGALSVQPMPNNECCSQPSLVWYTPLTPLEHRKVGYTTSASYAGGAAGEAWERAEENSAFYGAFTF